MGRKMNGFELYDRIHARKEFAAIPAFMVTGNQKNCVDEANQRNLPCLKKPFEFEAFLDTLEDLITPTNEACDSTS